MSTDPTDPPAGDAAGTQDIFVRNATGLVRELNGAQQIGFNLIGSVPTVGVAVSLFFAAAAFPRGNFYIATLITIPVVLAFTYAFGLLTAAMPRTGGDYVLVGRILHPAVGLMSSFCLILALAWSEAFLATATVQLGVAPGLTVIGIVGKSKTLLDWGNTLVSNKNWQFAVGLGLILASGALIMLGWRWLKRVLTPLVLFSIGGLFVSVIVALFTSKHGFRTDFNSIANPLTHSTDSYAATLAGASKSASAGSGSSPLPLVGVLAAFAIFVYYTSYIGSEIRQGASRRTGHRMALAGLATLAILVVSIFAFYHSPGKAFLIASYSGGYPKALGSAVPGYFVLTSLQSGNTVLAVLLSLAFVAFWPAILAVTIIPPTRVLFAYAFDGILPTRISNVSRRGAPTIATACTTILFILVLVWATYITSNFATIFSYGVLVQLVSMGLVGVAAMAFPYLRPEMYRASVSNATVLGVPIVVLAGAGAVISTIALWWIYIKYSYFGVGKPLGLVVWTGGALVAANAFYLGARALRRRAGIDLGKVYAEIPPA